MSDVVAIILAAGRATRFGAGPDTTKALALLQGKALVCWVTEAALASRASTVIVVTGHASAAVDSALASLPVHRVKNPAYAEGMAGSLKAGLEALPQRASGAVVLLADMPKVTPAIIDRLISSYESGGSKVDAVVPVRNGRLGNPVLLGRSIFAAVGTLSGDQGARRLFDDPQRIVLSCPIDDEAIEIDVDTPAALAALDRAG
ncbi:NTP transferase domain-containing protein [Beijerinckia sp. L45]|uniref:nucleotidyltransferase family protein n=1 Tax=Beijerinckia sp. L45 TaxID=1641855 RepID=UPI00131E81EB|nr:nucleotidyltransferase family protein [Beijerinckia sp. L45]